MIPTQSQSAKVAIEPQLVVVGIGASAGGLEAFSQLFQHLPATTGMAYVLVQHQDPIDESDLVRLLRCRTTMPVLEAMAKT